MEERSYSFKSLECWKVAVEIRGEIRVITKSLPKHELYALADQITRSSRSVTANIAEGYGRFHIQESIQFYRLSRASMCETLDHLVIALEEEYISKEKFTALKHKVNRFLKLINGFINYQKKLTSSTGQRNSE